MRIVLTLCIIVIVLVVLLNYLKVIEYYRDYLRYKTKCFSCEDDIRRRYGNDAVWMANPSKTFTAEIDGIRQAGGDIAGGFLGKTIKYY